MRQRLIKALGAIALGWLAGTAAAQTPREPMQPVYQDEPLGGAARAAYPPSTLHGTCLDGCHDGKTWLIGGGGTIWALTPAWDPNPAFRLVTTSGGVRTVDQIDFIWGVKFAYGGWIEAVNAQSGLGTRIRGFTFHQSETQAFTGFTPAGGGTQGLASAAPLGLGFSSLDVGFLPGETALFWSEMNIDIYDLEGTFALPRLGGIDITGVLGTRYMHMQQTYTAATSAASIAGLAGLGAAGVVTVDSTHNFNGGGTTIGIDAKRRIGESALAFYANPRGSILIGSAREGATFSAPGSTVLSSPLTTAQLNNMDVIPIMEIDSGIEFGRFFGRTRQSYAFVQLGTFAQVFFGGGNAANNANMNASVPGGVIGINGVTTFTPAIFSPDRGNFALWGATVKAGITF